MKNLLPGFVFLVILCGVGAVVVLANGGRIPTPPSLNPPLVAVCTSDGWTNNGADCATPGHLSKSDLTHGYLVLHMRSNNTQSEAVVRVYDKGADGNASSSSFVANAIALSAGPGDWGWAYKDTLKPDSTFASSGSYVPHHVYEVDVIYGSLLNQGQFIGTTQFTYDG